MFGKKPTVCFPGDFKDVNIVMALAMLGSHSLGRTPSLPRSPFDATSLYKRPTLVHVFTNQRKPQEDFLL